MRKIGLWGVMLGLVAGACGDDGASPPTAVSSATGVSDASASDASSPGTSAPSASSSGASSSDASSPDAGQLVNDAAASNDAGSHSDIPTYYADVLPLFEEYCLSCHTASGIGPFRLDDYATAKSQAAVIEAATANRSMPPYLVTNDGTCGEFAHSPYLSTAELKTISDWVQAGAPEGTPRAPVLPPAVELADAESVLTPDFTPAPGGGVLDEHDDYRCFLMDAPPVGSVITGYNVIPGNSTIVHHVVVTLVDLAGTSDYPAGDSGVVTNESVIQQLDDQDPDIEGWKCFGLAGEGVRVSGVPVVWAPGQGIVTFPDHSGVPVSENQKFVVQIHYNLEDHDNIGQSDSTELQFELKSALEVPNIGVYLPNDPLLNSLLSGGEPTLLPPGKASTKYTWANTFEELGMPVSEFKLWGIFPHMHQTGHRYTFEVKHADTGKTECKAQVNQWDFHWQHLYFYTEPEVLTPADSVHITCDFDTTSKTEPVAPGWGTQNEMCFAGVFVTVPNPAYVPN